MLLADIKGENLKIMNQIKNIKEDIIPNMTAEMNDLFITDPYYEHLLCIRILIKTKSKANHAVIACWLLIIGETVLIQIRFVFVKPDVDLNSFKLWKLCTLKPGHQRGLTG